MKVLRFLVILVLILVVGYLVLCAVSAKELNSERSTTINAPASVVWDQILYFKNHHNWSPWNDMDSTMKETYEGTDGQPGSKMHYTGEIVKEGIMENMGVNGMNLSYAMHFITPFKAEATGNLIVSEENGMTKATQTYHQELPFFMRGFFGLMGGEKMMAKNFDRGLQLLKEYSEAHASDIKIEDVQFPGHNYAAIRKVVKWDDMMQFFSDSYGMLGKEAGPRIAGYASCLAYSWDTTNHQAELAAAFPVNGTEPVKGATMINVAASPAYMIEYKGPYSGFMAVHDALGKHVGMMGKTPSLVIEEYVKGPGDNVDSTNYVSKIYYLYQ